MKNLDYLRYSQILMKKVWCLHNIHLIWILDFWEKPDRPENPYSDVTSNSSSTSGGRKGGKEKTLTPWYVKKDATARPPSLCYLYIRPWFGLIYIESCLTWLSSRLRGRGGEDQRGRQDQQPGKLLRAPVCYLE